MEIVVVVVEVVVIVIFTVHSLLHFFLPRKQEGNILTMRRMNGEKWEARRSAGVCVVE